MVDSGYCSGLVVYSQEECELSKNLNMIDPLCAWNDDEQTCTFADPKSDFLSTLVLTFVITSAAIPLDKLLMWLLFNITQFAEEQWNKLNRTQAMDAEDVVVGENDMDSFDLKRQESLGGKFFRAARLRVMQESIDFVNPEQELVRY